MSEYIIQRETLESIANAVREKKGTTDLIPVSSLASEILSIESGGGGEQTTGDFWVKVIDYDGTVLLEKRGNNGGSFDLPSAPSHEGLVFQEWSASQEITDNKITIADNNVMVGAIYTTASGQNEFDITLTKVTGLKVTLYMDGTKNWGDGTSDTNTTHTYTAYGDYTIKCDGTKKTSSYGSGLFGSSTTINYYCTAARFATVTSISSFLLQLCRSLTNVIIPNGVTKIGSNAFNDCCSLTNVIIPNEVTSMGSNVFSSCYSLTNVIIPNGVTKIGSNAFSGCYSLTNVIIPNGVTSIGSEAFDGGYSLTNVIIPYSVMSINDYSFGNCYALTKYVFSKHSSVPTLSDTNAFFKIKGICKIIVPDSLYDEWIAATNWSTYADYIYKASEVTA